jgi:hypothetical protein
MMLTFGDPGKPDRSHRPRAHKGAADRDGPSIEARPVPSLAAGRVLDCGWAARRTMTDSPHSHEERRMRITASHEPAP